MLKQPERESRNVNDLFYEMEGRQIQKMNKVLEGVEPVSYTHLFPYVWLCGMYINGREIYISQILLYKILYLFIYGIKIM